MLLILLGALIVALVLAQLVRGRTMRREEEASMADAARRRARLRERRRRG